MTPWFGVLRQLRALREADRRRTGVPGEHWAALGAAIGTLGTARRIASPWLRAATLVLGGVLFLRAISGRDGALSIARRKAQSRRYVGEA